MVKIPKKSMTHKHSNDADAFLIQEAPRKSRDGILQRNGNGPAVTGQTPSLQELFRQDCSASKSADEREERMDHARVDPPGVVNSEPD